MKIKLKYVTPMGSKSFRMHIAFSFLMHFVFIIFAVILAHLEIFSLPHWGTGYLLIAISLLDIVVLGFVYDVHKFRARFKDIYPDHDLNIVMCYTMLFFPLVFFMFVTFLCLKDNDQANKPLKIFRLNYFIPAVLSLLIIQALSPNLAFWTASPSVSFSVTTFHDAARLISFKKQSKNRINILEEYQNISDESISSTELVLLTAVSAGRIVNAKKRSITTSGKSMLTDIDFALDLVEANQKLLLKGRSIKFSFFNYSPLQWIHASGPVEILIINSIEQEIIKKFNDVIFRKTSEILSAVDEKVNHFGPKDKDMYLKRINHLKVRLADANMSEFK